jgi:hypothetical protein
MANYKKFQIGAFFLFVGSYTQWLSFSYNDYLFFRIMFAARFLIGLSAVYCIEYLHQKISTLVVDYYSDLEGSFFGWVDFSYKTSVVAAGSFHKIF